MTERSILIVDDEPDLLVLLKRSLEPDLNCRVTVVSSGAEALQQVSRQDFDLILADIKMPGMDGLALLELVKQDHPEQTVVMMTGHGSIETAVEAMKNGAYDFITKPFDHEALLLRLEKALERSTLKKENRRLKKESRPTNVFQDLVGKSAVMRRVFETIRMVADTEFTVLITGESGTGKDLTARAIHTLSPRSEGPYVPVNCPTVPEHILESELFGYKKGAFTHATQNKIGLFQEANRGTIFLDEIGDVSPAIQTKLLRVIQEKEIKPLGDTRTISVDVRIVSSTNQNLREKIRQGSFREDLFYRLNVLPIHLPALRDRREDIPLIASHLLEKHCKSLSKPLKALSPELMDRFAERQWEGNVRELENVIIQGILFSGGDEIQPRDVRLERPPHSPASPSVDAFRGLAYKDAKEKTLQQFNSAYLGRILAETGGNITQAARVCGLERQSLQQIMRRYGITAEGFR